MVHGWDQKKKSGKKRGKYPKEERRMTYKLAGGPF